MNDDVVCEASALDVLAGAIRAGADVALPQLVDGGGRPTPSIAALPGAGALLREWAALPDRPVPGLAGRIHVEKWRRPDSAERVDAASAPVVAVRRALLDQHPLPEDYFLYWEESEWFFRLAEVGARVEYRPDAVGRAPGRPRRRAAREGATARPQRGAVRATDTGSTRRGGGVSGGHRVVDAARARRQRPRAAGAALVDGGHGTRRRSRCRGRRMARGRPLSVVLVDWLGRGGIAQTSEAWVDELDASGHDVCVVTRGEPRARTRRPSERPRRRRRGDPARRDRCAPCGRSRRRRDGPRAPPLVRRRPELRRPKTRGAVAPRGARCRGSRHRGGAR